MKNSILLILLFLSGIYLNAQPTGYYNGTEGEDGEELKSTLHQIIDQHTVFSYYNSKSVLKISDADPVNSSHVILVYTGRSQDNNDYGTGGNQINREHVWAKSHGNFDEVYPMYSDVHNLKPCDCSVNQDKGNKDFDNGGTQHTEATGCYYTTYTWEARDEVKGDIARIIFYMSVRYEGDNGEIDLEVVDAVNTYPYPEHGKLSTLLEWNLQDPPDEFEINRNNVIFAWQKNRNPFVDNPEFAQLIWGGEIASPLKIGDVTMNPAQPTAEIPVTISCDIISSEIDIVEVTLYWGLAWNNLTNEVEMISTGGHYNAEIPGQAEGTTVFYKIEAVDGMNSCNTVTYNYYVPEIFNGTITSIFDIQGQQSSSPYDSLVVSTTGVVTGNFGNNYFIQNGFGEWNGLFCYDPGRNPEVGDSLVLTGTIDEYYELTEIKDISGYYRISTGHTLPAHAIINTGDAGEPYESVLIKVLNATCTDANYQANYYMWKVNDGTGTLLIHNSPIFEYEPVEGDAYNISGPLNYDFDEWKIELRSEEDVQPGEDNISPTIESIAAITNSIIKISFSEDVDEATAETVANYSINNDITVLEANLHSIVKSDVYLTVSEMEDEEYEASVQNVEDLSGNVMDPVTIPFTNASSIGDGLMVSAMNLFPNPANNNLNLEFVCRNTSAVHIKISDFMGNEVFEKGAEATIGENSFQVNVSGFSTGFYIVSVKFSDHMPVYLKFLKK